MAYSVADGKYFVTRDGVNGEVSRFATELEAKADAEAKTLSTGSVHVVNFAEWSYARETSYTTVETDV